jgi:hypothetical protein
MSQSRPPHGPASSGHPDEALAAFSDGTATPDERAMVLDHLQGCSACRREIELARRAIDALGSLAEPEAPGLDPAAIVRRAGNVVGIRPSHGAGGRWARVGSRGLAAGIASGLVAAGIVAVLAVAVVRLGGSGSPTASTAEGGGAGAPVAPTFSFGSARTNYTPTSIDALAATVAATPGLLEQRGFSHSTSLTTKDATVARSCVADQTRNGMQPLGLVLARFQDKPAFVEVFRDRSPGAGSVRVVVADHNTCAVLYTTNHSLPPG